ncbi:8499_t:CDS:2 [Entrophospora sp. SA101]|nr:8499_t:CDS:2 [Entrophospora sp. SA101]
MQQENIMKDHKSLCHYDQETPYSLSQQMRSTQTGRPQSKVWQHFSKIQSWRITKIINNLANYCMNCGSQTRKKCLEELSEDSVKYEENDGDSNCEDDEDNDNNVCLAQLNEPLLQISNTTNCFEAFSPEFESNQIGLTQDLNTGNSEGKLDNILEPKTKSKNKPKSFLENTIYVVNQFLVNHQ